MKKGFLAFSIAVLLFNQPGTAQTSVYHPFPNDSASSYVSWAIWAMGIEDVGAFRYIFDDDTMINSVTYKKIYKAHWNFFTNSVQSTPYVGALRDDTLARKVYLILPNDTADTLLYDFTLQPGDTIRGYLADISVSTEITVDFIDSILIGNSYRKQFVLTGTGPGGPYSYVEGIGNLSAGLLESYFQFEAGTFMECFWEGDDLIYPMGMEIYCASVGIREKTTPHETLLLFPNPAHDFINLHDESKIISPTVQIIDVVGKIVFEKSNFTSKRIDISALNSGVYFLKYSGKNNYFIKKFLVNKI